MIGPSYPRVAGAELGLDRWAPFSDASYGFSFALKGTSHGVVPAGPDSAPLLRISNAPLSVDGAKNPPLRVFAQLSQLGRTLNVQFQGKSRSWPT